MGISSRGGGSRPVLLTLACSALLLGCADPASQHASPATAPTPEPRHPITAPKAGGDGRARTVPEPEAPDVSGPPRGPNVRVSRPPGDRDRERPQTELPAPLSAPAPLDRPPPISEPIRPKDTAPVGTIDTRPGTIRPPHLEIPGQ